MTPLNQYIEHHIDALNQLDQELLRWEATAKDCDDRQSPQHQSLSRALESLRNARNLADKRLFELFSMRSVTEATPEITARAELAWAELRTAWKSVVALRGHLGTGSVLRIDLLLDATVKPG